MAELQLRGISKSYGKTSVLEPVDLTIRDGEIFFLLGPSGCGKSTLLRIIAGLLTPDAGTLLLDGADITQLPPEKRNTPMVFQNYALWPHLNVSENISFGMKSRGMKADVIRKRVEELLEIVQLTDLKTRKITALSGGQQQRVALARALAIPPAVILFDEPLSNLDAKLRDTMRLEIRRICREKHLTAIYVTHDRKEALSMADRIAVLDAGRIRQIGSPREIYHAPRNRFVASFLGDVNFLAANLQKMGNGTAVFHTSIGDVTVNVPADRILHTEQDYTLMCRPENIQFNGAPDAQNRFPVSVSESTYLGESAFYLLSCGGTVLSASEFGNTPERGVGTEGVVSVAPADWVILEKE